MQGAECGDLLLFQAMVKIEDMAVSLILEEWGCQNLARRNLNRDSRQMNLGTVFSQGKTNAEFLSAKIFFASVLVSKGKHLCLLSSKGIALQLPDSWKVWYL